MPTFRYQATGRDGQALQGMHVADTLEAARRQLEATGLTIRSLEQAPAEPESRQPAEAATLSQADFLSDDALALGERAAGLIRSGLPLNAGLRALAEETSTPRVRKALEAISQRLESGASIEDTLEHFSGHLPADLRMLIGAGVRSGRLPETIERYLEITRERLDLRRCVAASLTYPAILLLVFFGIMLGLFRFVIPDFTAIFEGFDTELPALTMLVVDLSRFVTKHDVLLLTLTCLGLATIICASWWLNRHWTAPIERLRLPQFIAGPAMRRRLSNIIPLFGAMRQMQSQSRFCGTLSLLVENNVALPEALRVAGLSSRDANLAEGALHLAVQVERGTSLHVAAWQNRRFPRGLVNVFRWEQHGSAFPELLQANAASCSYQTRAIASLVGVVLEPVIICTIAIVVAFNVISLFLPLVQLLNDLS